MEIIIVGAGLGGVTAAFGLGRKGHHVRVYERKELFQPAGTAVDVRPNAMRVLRSWGIQEDVNSVGESQPVNSLRDAVSGCILSSTRVEDVGGFATIGTWRDYLIEVLYKKACELETVEFHFDTVAEMVEDSDEGATLFLGDGTKIQADLIIAADGIQSRLRKEVLCDLTEPMEPISNGATLHPLRLHVDDEMLKMQNLKRLVDNANLNSWMGDNIYCVSRFNRKQATLAIGYGVRAETDQISLFDTKADMGYLRRTFQGACLELRSALELAESCGRWKLTYMPKLSRWTSRKGRIVLLGDSAHGMTPNAGQGYSVTVEDIGVLEHLINISTDPVAHLPLITRSWQEVRKPRVDRMGDYSLFNNQMFMGTKVPKVVQDSEVVQVQSLQDIVADRDAFYRTPEFRKWSMDYDAIGEVNDYLHQNGIKL